MDRKLITRRDAVILILIVLSAVCLFIFSNLRSDDNFVAVITVDGVEVQKTDLKNVADEQIITLDNGIKVRLYDHSISFFESNCRDKICIHSGELRKAGDVAACLPNRTVISVVCEKDSGVDIITY